MSKRRRMMAIIEEPIVEVQKKRSVQTRLTNRQKIKQRIGRAPLQHLVVDSAMTIDDDLAVNALERSAKKEQQPALVETPQKLMIQKPKNVWNCQDCFSENLMSVDQCPCCEAIRPGASVEPKKVAMPQSSGFVMPTVPATSGFKMPAASEGSNGFQFGGSESSFKFGGQASDTSIKFGGPTSEAPFKFSLQSETFKVPTDAPPKFETPKQEGFRFSGATDAKISPFKFNGEFPHATPPAPIQPEMWGPFKVSELQHFKFKLDLSQAAKLSKEDVPLAKFKFDL